jgi:hypothetical protein
MIRLAYAGATEAELAACSGHSSLAMVRFYIEQANKERLADMVTARLLGTGER